MNFDFLNEHPLTLRDHAQICTIVTGYMQDGRLNNLCPAAGHGLKIEACPLPPVRLYSHRLTPVCSDPGKIHR